MKLIHWKRMLSVQNVYPFVVPKSNSIRKYSSVCSAWTTNRLEIILFERIKKMRKAYDFIVDCIYCQEFPIESKFNRTKLRWVDKFQNKVLWMKWKETTLKIRPYHVFVYYILMWKVLTWLKAFSVNIFPNNQIVAVFVLRGSEIWNVNRGLLFYLNIWYWMAI